MDDYSRASWVLPLRAKLDAPVEFEKWAAMMQNGTGKTIRTVMFDNAKEFVAGKMREFCNERRIRIITSVPYSPSYNGIAERLVGVATYGTRAMLRDSGLPPRFWAKAMTTFMYLRNRMPTKANDGKTLFELFYGMKPDISHIRAFGCVTKVVLPGELLGKLDDWAAMGYLLRYKYDGAYRVWVPKLGIRESRDVTFYENENATPTPPEHGSITEVQRSQDILTPKPPTIAPVTPQIDTSLPPPVDGASSDDTSIPPSELRDERIIIRIPGRDGPRRAAQQHARHIPRTPLPDDTEAKAPVPTNLMGDEDNEAPQYVGRIHQYPGRST